MEVNKTSASPGSSAELQAAAELVLEREKDRKQLKQKRAKQKRCKRQREERKSVQRMHNSIEVIKKLIIGICTVWVASFIISIIVLVRVHTKVVEIEDQVDRIQHVLENPFASAGARAGSDLDTRLKEWLKLPDPGPGIK